MKAGRGIELPQATKIFTDREEPRAAFHKLYNRCIEEMARGENNVHVLTYYGIGGIGKTTLLKKLGEEMTERYKGARFVHFDLRHRQERTAVMDAIKNLLTEQYRFTFPLYELGCYFYLRKVGANPSAPEIRRLSDQSPLLRTAFTVLDKIPVVEIGAKVLEALDAGVAGVRSYFANHPKELRDIKFMDAEKLYDHLPLLFAQDLNENLKNAKAPLVIFLDTYELLVNELSAMGDPLLNDLWLRGMTSLVPNALNVLWVIAGREMLRWREINEEWADALEQHNLGNLSPLDSDRFLSGASVEGPDLREGLYRLTGGTPVYLDLCVDQYHQMLKRGETPLLSSFGTDTRELTERYSRYLDDGQKDLVQLLACLKRWTDATVEELFPVLLPGFSYATYEKLKSVSFIDKNAAGIYNMHQTVSEVLSKQCPPALRQKLGAAILQNHAVPQEQAPSVLDPAFAEQLAQETEAAILTHTDREALCDYYQDHLRARLEQLSKAGRFSQAQAILTQLWAVAAAGPKDRLYASLLTERAFHLTIAGQPVRTYLPLAEEACALCAPLLGADHPDTLRALSMRALALRCKGDLDTAMELQQRILEGRTRTLGATHPETLSTRFNIGILHADCDRYQEALEEYTAVLEERKKQLGEDHIKTLTIMHSIGNVLSNMGNYEEAFPLRTTVYEKRRAMLGEDHLDTLRAASSLANVLNRLERREEALALHRTVLEKRKEILGEEHTDTLWAMNNMAFTLDKMGQKEEALQLYKEICQKRRALFGDDEPDTLWAIRNYVLALEDLERFEEALPLRRVLWEQREKNFGPNHADTLQAVRALAHTLYQLGHYAEAVTHYQTHYDRCVATFGQSDEQTLNALRWLTYGRIRNGEPAEALALATLRMELLQKQGKDITNELELIGLIRKILPGN